jgi:hypothetical protein
MSKEEQDDADVMEGDCELCGRPLTYSGDNWDGLCPSCADRVSLYLDDNCLNDEHRDDAI